MLRFSLYMLRLASKFSVNTFHRHIIYRLDWFFVAMKDLSFILERRGNRQSSFLRLSVKSTLVITLSITDVLRMNYSKRVFDICKHLLLYLRIVPRYVRATNYR